MKLSFNAKILLLAVVLASCSSRNPASTLGERSPASSAEASLDSAVMSPAAAKVLSQYLSLLDSGSFLTRDQAHEKFEKIPANEKDQSGHDVVFIFRGYQYRAISGNEYSTNVLVEYRLVGMMDSEQGFQQFPETAVFALFKLQKIKQSWRIVARDYFHNEYVGPFLSIEAGVRELGRANKPTSGLESLKN